MSDKLKKQIKTITDRIIQDYQPEKIILFGSAASGKMQRWSDVDLAIVKDTKRRFFDRIGETLKLLRPIENKPPLDIIVYTPKEFRRMARESCFVRNEIIRKGKTLYG
jgi:predicted nucleotidyltransferase